MTLDFKAKIKINIICPHFSRESTPEPEPKPKTEATVESDPESDVDIDNSGCVEPDTDSEQAMGDPAKEPSEDDFDKAGELRSQGAAHYSEQRYDDAVKAYEQAIILNPTNALFYAKRGQAYLKLDKPNACIRDCNRALELNWYVSIYQFSLWRWHMLFDFITLTFRIYFAVTLQQLINSVEGLIVCWAIGKRQQRTCVKHGKISFILV